MGFKIPKRTHPRIVAKRKKLFALLKAHYKEDAAATTWPHEYDAGQHAEDDVYVSEHTSRIWNIVIGDYLADKGFHIEDTLIDFGAGLFRPPTRLKKLKTHILKCEQL